MCPRIRRQLPHIESEVETVADSSRVRRGYCKHAIANVLEGKPLEKQLNPSHRLSARFDSWRAAGAYFLHRAETARVNLAMEIPADTFSVNKGREIFTPT